MVPNAVRNRRRQRPLLWRCRPHSSQHRCRARKLVAWAATSLVCALASMVLACSSDKPDLLELVIALVKAGNHVLAEHGVIIGDDPELDLNSHGPSQGSMADKLQPTCLPQRWPRHPTDFDALTENVE